MIGVTDPATTPPPQRPSKRAHRLLIAGLVAGAALTMIAMGGVVDESTLAAIATWIQHVPVPLVGLLVVVGILVGVPSSALTIALGMAYGPAWGASYALLTITSAGLLNILVVRRLLRGRRAWIERHAGRLCQSSSRSRCLALTGIRLVGTPLLAVALLAGGARVALGWSAVAIAAGSAPRTIAWSFAGSSAMAGAHSVSIILAAIPLVFGVGYVIRQSRQAAATVGAPA